MQVSPRAPRRRARGGGGPQLRATPTRRPASRAGATRAACASSPRTGLRLAATDVLVCSTGLIGIPMPMDALEAGIPKLCGDARRAEGGARRRAGDPHHRHRAQGSDAPRAGGPRSSAAWPRARRCCRPRWRRCSRCSPPTPRSTPDVLQQALAGAVDDDLRLLERRRVPLAPTTPCSCSPTAAAGDRSTRHALDRRAHRGVRLARRADGARRRRCDEVRARRRASARAPRPRRASRRARSPTASSCSARSTAATPTGAGCSPSSARAARSSIPSRSTSPTTASRCAATASRARTTRPRSRRTWPAARSRSLCDLRLGARRGDGAHHRPLARVHRREPAHVVTRRVDVASRIADAGEKATSSPRRCRTSASSRARRSSSSTAVTRWTIPTLADLFATDVVLMRLVGHEPGRRARRRSADHAT